MLRAGIDLGGTSAKIALVNQSKRVVRHASVVTAGKPKPADLVDRISTALDALLKGSPIQRVGVGVAGDIDSDKGIVRVSPNLGWTDVPLGPMLRKKLKKPVKVDNDANVASWGIYKTQINPNVRHLIVLTLGTGVGGGIILDKKIHHGATGTAGEIGHTIVVDNGRQCNCGNRGCLETYAGGFYLTREVKRRLEDGEESALRSLYENDPDQINPFVIAETAKKGDPFCLSVWREVGHILGVAIGNLIYTFNPEVIYLTGGVAQAKNLIMKPLMETLKQRAFKDPILAASIKVAERAARMGVVGASLL